MFANLLKGLWDRLGWISRESLRQMVTCIPGGRRRKAVQEVTRAALVHAAQVQKGLKHDRVLATQERVDRVSGTLAANYIKHLNGGSDRERDLLKIVTQRGIHAIFHQVLCRQLLDQPSTYYLLEKQARLSR